MGIKRKKNLQIRFIPIQTLASAIRDIQIVRGKIADQTLYPSPTTLNTILIASTAKPENGELHIRMLQKALQILNVTPKEIRCMKEYVFTMGEAEFLRERGKTFEEFASDIASVAETDHSDSDEEQIRYINFLKERGKIYYDLAARVESIALQELRGTKKK